MPSKNPWKTKFKFQITIGRRAEAGASDRSDGAGAPLRAPFGAVPADHEPDAKSTPAAADRPTDRPTDGVRVWFVLCVFRGGRDKVLGARERGPPPRQTC